MINLKAMKFRKKTPVLCNADVDYSKGINKKQNSNFNLHTNLQNQE